MSNDTTTTTTSASTSTATESTPRATRTSADTKTAVIEPSADAKELLAATRHETTVETEYAHTSNEDGIVNHRVVVEFPAGTEVVICDEWQCDGDSVERELSVTVPAVPIEYAVEADYPALSTRAAGPLADRAEQVSAVVSELEGEEYEYQVIAADALAAYAPAEADAETEIAAGRDA